jgi:hypothetical protein
MHEFRQNFCDRPKFTQDLRHNGHPAANLQAPFGRQGGRHDDGQQSDLDLGHSRRAAGITQIRNKGNANNKQNFLDVFFVFQNLSLTVCHLSHIMIAMSAQSGNSTVPISKKAPATDSIPHKRIYSSDYSFVGCIVELFAAGRTVQPQLRSCLGRFAVRFSTV